MCCTCVAEKIISDTKKEGFSTIIIDGNKGINILAIGEPEGEAIVSFKRLNDKKWSPSIKVHDLASFVIKFNLDIKYEYYHKDIKDYIEYRTDCFALT
jgi:hypothetical protein